MVRRAEKHARLSGDVRAKWDARPRGFGEDLQFRCELFRVDFLPRFWNAYGAFESIVLDKMELQGL